MQVYPYTGGSLYQVYTAAGQITDIALQPGEQLVGSGPVAAGDTVRWIIGDTLSGSGATQQVHILVKPTRPELMTNLIINTTLRTYHMELRSTERSEEHTSELQSLMRTSYAVFCLKKKQRQRTQDRRYTKHGL